jgi:hypothetical protein
MDGQGTDERQGLGKGWARFGLGSVSWGRVWGVGRGPHTPPNLYRVISVWRSPSNSNAAMSVNVALSSIFSGTPEAALDSFTQSIRSKCSFIMKVTLDGKSHLFPWLQRPGWWGTLERRNAMTTSGLMARGFNSGTTRPVVLSSAAPGISISPLDSARECTSLSASRREDDRGSQPESDSAPPGWAFSFLPVARAHSYTSPRPVCRTYIRLPDGPVPVRFGGSAANQA